MNETGSPTPARRDAQLGVTISRPERVVVTLFDAGEEPDPTYATVLFQTKLADGSFFEIELSRPDAQRLGQKLNAAGGGVLTDAENLRESLVRCVAAMKLVPFGDTVEGKWGEEFTQAQVEAQRTLGDFE